MSEQRVVIRHENGAEGAVLPEAFGDPKLAENFKGARIIRNEDGTPYDGPTTPEGMAHKIERETEARREARRQRSAAREAASDAEPEKEVEPVARGAAGKG